MFQSLRWSLTQDKNCTMWIGSQPKRCPTDKQCREPVHSWKMSQAHKSECTGSRLSRREMTCSNLGCKIHRMTTQKMAGKSQADKVSKECSLLANTCQDHNVLVEVSVGSTIPYKRKNQRLWNLAPTSSWTKGS